MKGKTLLTTDGVMEDRVSDHLCKMLVAAPIFFQDLRATDVEMFRKAQTSMSADAVPLLLTDARVPTSADARGRPAAALRIGRGNRLSSVRVFGRLHKGLVRPPQAPRIVAGLSRGDPRATVVSV